MRTSGHPLASSLRSDGRTRLNESGSHRNERAAGAGIGRTRSVRNVFRRGRAGRREVAAFMRSLSVLVEARIPVVDALELLSAGGAARSNSGGALREQVREIAAEIRRGRGFADCLAMYPGSFRTVHCELVRVGEETGQLGYTLERIADQEERSLELRRQVRSAMAYPSLVIAISIATTAFLLVAVVPRFAEMFSGFGAELPGPTQLIVTASTWLTGNVILLPAIPAFIIGLVYAVRKLPAARISFHRLLFRLPVTGTVAQKACLGHYCSVLSTLLESGIVADRAVTFSIRCVDNLYFRESAANMTAGLRSGRSLAAVAADTGLFTPFALDLILAGERSGELPPALNHIARFYETEVAAATDALASLIEPLLIVIVGTILAGLLAALYLPMLDLVQVIH